MVQPLPLLTRLPPAPPLVPPPDEPAALAHTTWLTVFDVLLKNALDHGRGEVVVSSGEGRSVTLVVTLANAVGGTTGPMTLTVDAPLSGGQQTAGKYQLFLPTP